MGRPGREQMMGSDCRRLVVIGPQQRSAMMKLPHPLLADGIVSRAVHERVQELAAVLRESDQALPRQHVDGDGDRPGGCADRDAA